MCVCVCLRVGGTVVRTIKDLLFLPAPGMEEEEEEEEEEEMEQGRGDERSEDGSYTPSMITSAHA